MTMHRGAAFLLATLALAGCGGAAASRPATTATTTAAGAARTRPNRTQLAACLRKQGVQLPQRPRNGGGQSRRGAGGGLLFGGGGGGGFGGANRTKLQAALRACGVQPGQFRGRGRSNPTSPAYRQALARFVSCVRRNGYDLPAPNTTGRGPVFDPTKVNRNDPKFVAASRKCESLLPQRPGAPPVPVT
jgi:hypothetical protein